MDYQVKAFLKKNNINDYSKYRIMDRSDGKGPFIEKWDYEIDAPTREDFKELTAEDIKSIKMDNMKCNYTEMLLNPDFIKFLFPDIDDLIIEFCNTVGKKYIE